MGFEEEIPMGFLDKLISKSVKDIAKQVEKNLAGALNGAAQPQPAVPAPQPAPAPQAAAPADTSPSAPVLNVRHNEPFAPVAAQASSVADRGSVAYFADVIGKNIPGVTLETDVPLTALGLSAEKGVPVSVAVYKAGTPALAILVTPKNGYRRYGVINTMNALEARGIPAIRFMKEFANEPGYVVGRVLAVMR